MKKVTIDELLAKIPNRYLLAIYSGKKYKEALEKLVSEDDYVSHDLLSNKVFNEVLKDDVKDFIKKV